MKIILLRHGEDPSDVRGGWSEREMTTKGIVEVKEAARRLADLDFDVILSSDLKRAVQTAKVAAGISSRKIHIDADLREINNGELAGMKNSVANEKYPGLYYNTLAFDQKYPGGESPQDFYERVKKVYDRIVAMNKNVLVVTHSGVINVFYCLANGLEYTNTKDAVTVGHAGYIVIEPKSI